MIEDYICKQSLQDELKEKISTDKKMRAKMDEKLKK